MSGYHEFIKDPMLRAQMVKYAAYKSDKWKICACGKPATELDCEGARLINRCKGCFNDRKLS